METSLAGFNPANYPDIPLYNIQAVASATGVPSITLRSWERRYGVPQPKRDAKGYRLYSERDLAVTRWLKERVEHGVGISRAVNMLRALEKGQLAPPPPPTLDFDALQSRLVDAIRRLDEAGVSRVVAEALMVASVEEVSLQVLQPALYQVGALWADGLLSVTTEHVGSNLVRSQLAQLVRISPPPFRHDKVLVGSAPGELHDIGALMVALFLRRRGFDVIYAGANVEPDSLIVDAMRLGPAAVCLSASSPETVESLAALIEQLNAVYKGVRAFGGRIFNERQELVDRVPGIFLGLDAASATTNLESRLAS